MSEDAGFFVAPARLTEVGSSLAAAAARVGQLDLRAPLTRAASALPGSVTAAVVGDLAAAWSATTAEIASGITRHATALTVAADHYEGTDLAAASGLSAVVGGEGR